MPQNMPADPQLSRRRCLVIRFAAASASGHGGQRRSCQIDQRLREEGFDCEAWLVPPRNRWRWLRNLARHGLAELIKLRRLGFTVRGALEVAMQYPDLERIDASRYDRVVIEATNCAAATIWAHRQGLDAVAYPHNVECLVDPFVGSPAVPRRLALRLIDEVATLKLVDEVHTISGEDAWFYAQFGIRASVFPYSAIATSSVTARQPCSHRHRILVMGTATNPPTAHGIEQVIANAPPVEGVIYTIVGAGTERFRAAAMREDVEICGRVSNARLIELYSETRYALCYQEFGSGLLTRIENLLTEGIPVWANRHAARGYAPRPDLHVFENWAEFATAISAE